MPDTIYLNDSGQTMDTVYTLLYGGAGNDQVFNSTPLDAVGYGGGGDDALYFSGIFGRTLLFGGSGNDRLEGGATPIGDQLFGGTGNDILRGAFLDAPDGAPNWLDGGPGRDVLYGTTGDDTLIGGGDDDSPGGGAITAGNGVVVETALPGLYGGDGNDYLDGGTGNDFINAGAGSDLLYGGFGNDDLRGFSGNDAIDGGFGNDSLQGGLGSDILIGGYGDDTYGMFDDATDTVVEAAGGGTDTVYASLSYALPLAAEIEVLAVTPNDTPTALAVNLSGSNTDNAILGHPGKNTLSGLGGNDVVDGASGDDVLKGGTGDDTLIGGAGLDKLFGGSGKDTLTGGAGKDVFVFDAAGTTASADILKDFSHKDDTVWLENAIFKGIGLGSIAAPKKMAAAAFHAGAKAHDANDRIVYDKKLGALWYDADGTGAGAAVKIATFTTKPALDLSDFFAV